MREIAAGVTYDLNLPSTPPLPELKDSSAISFTSGAVEADLPDNYMGPVYLAVDTTYDRRVKIDASEIRFLRRDPAQNDAGGDPAYVCVRGRKLLRHPPARSGGGSIKIYYHRYPTDMSSAGDEPDGLPKEFHYKALVPYVCKELFDEIEDGVEGKKVNTGNQEAKFNKAMAELYRFYGPADGIPQYIEDQEDYIYNSWDGWGGFEE
jgi:hypothetical protein